MSRLIVHSFAISLAVRGRLRLALLAVFLLAAPRAARATVCATTVELSLNNGADAVFLGVVERSRPSFRHPMTQVVTNLRVLRAWKGVAESRVDLAWDIEDRWMGATAFVSTLRGDAMRGDTVLVAAWRTNGRLTTGVCTYWRERAAEREIALLGPGTTPPATGSMSRPGQWWSWPIVGGCLLLATAALRRIRRPAR